MAAPAKPIPVTMLSGFLGAGKTTLLRHLLENSTLKIGCVVNDVADVNIDAKLVRNDRSRQRGGGGEGGDGASGPTTTADLTDTVELANGCACCSIQDELFGSFEQLLALADAKGSTYDRIVLENSGVAEPQNIRDKFAEAVAAGHPLARRVALDAMVTIVDAGAFVGDYASRAPLAARPDLGEGGNLRPVVDLLVEQIECADFVILNKIDQLAEGGLDSLRAIVASLNPLARTVACERGRVDVEDVFGPASSGLVAHLTVEGQHRGAVAAAAEAAAKEEEGEEGEGDGHGHHHHHDHGHACGTDCKEEHDHKHHDHKHHDHDHDHKHHHHDHDGPCGDACAAKPKRARQDTTAASRFGIRSFVYRRRRPFHPGRLRDTVLRWLPVATNAALADGEGGDGGDPAASAAAAVVNGAAAAPPSANVSPIRTVLRSKGFMWMSHSHETAFYWSHAGQHFEIRDEGDWWAAVPRDSWPEDEAAVGVITADFDGGHGDRRQEIVFIGAGMDDAAIVAALDGALLTDEEMGTYEATFAGGGGEEGGE